MRDVGAGELFTPENVRIIRPGFGLPPSHLPDILGKRASRALTRGTRADVGRHRVKTVAIIQARMGSTRLPGKVLMDLGGRPVLAWVVRAARAAAGIDDVWVATSTAAVDDPVARLVRRQRRAGPSRLRARRARPLCRRDGGGAARTS